MKQILSILLTVAAMAAFSCSKVGDSAIRTGDLVFVQIPADYDLNPDSMESAIGAATSGGDSLMTIHVAILEVQGDSTWIIDATIRHGVDRHPLSTFLSDFTLRDGSLPLFDIRRPDVSASEARRFVDNAQKFLGEPYDVHFLPDNGALYCSELVYDAYVTEDGKHLFSAYPMNFLDAGGEMPPYWTELFALLGESVPQGVTGTNPQQMSGESCLKPVRKGFPGADNRPDTDNR